MRPEVTAADYREARGEIADADFGAALPFAVAAVDSLVGFNGVDGAAREAAWKRAVIAAVGIDAAYGFSHGVGENMVSMTVGAFTATFGSVSMQSASQPSPYERDMARAIRRELAGSGLLYQGIA